MSNIILERYEDGSTEAVAVKATDRDVRNFLSDNIGDYLVYDENGVDATSEFSGDDELAMAGTDNDDA